MNIATTKDGSIHRHPIVVSILLTGTPVTIELLLKMSADLLSLQLSVITVGIISGVVLS
jgi:hypothetical protein